MQKETKSLQEMLSDAYQRRMKKHILLFLILTIITFSGFVATLIPVIIANVVEINHYASWTLLNHALWLNPSYATFFVFMIIFLITSLIFLIVTIKLYQKRNFVPVANIY